MFALRALLRATASCAAELLYPSAANCMGCGDPLGADEGWLCAACAKKLMSLSTRDTPCCPICGRPGGEKRACSCARWPRGGLSMARYAYVYDGPVKGMIRRMKFSGVHLLCDWMAGEMADLICRAPYGPIDVIVPVPLHARRLNERGFNQALRLAEGISARLNLPVAKDELRRTRATRQQSKLRAEKRLDNLTDAFVAREGAFTGKRVLLVDDVLSTGQTAGQCAIALKRAGAADVKLAALAGAGAITKK